MLIYVACWPLLAWLAGELIPQIGKGDLSKVSQVIIIALIVFLIQKLAQFIQDTLLADPALKLSQELRSDIFRKLQHIELGYLEKLRLFESTQIISKVRLVDRFFSVF